MSLRFTVAPQRPAAGRAVTPVTASRQSITPFNATQPSAPGGVGDKLLPLLRTPFDLLALPGRVALGTLQSLPEVLEKIPSDVERLSLLAQDPRSLEEKQAEVLGELEDRVVGYLQKGTDAEGELLSTVSSVLPEPLKDALPEPLKEVLQPRTGSSGFADGGALGSSSNGSSNGNGAGASKPLATWTITSDDDSMAMAVAAVDSVDDTPPMTPAAIAASQTAAEVMEVNAAVAELKDQLVTLQTNADPSRTNMIKLNVREAEAILRGRLEQMAPSHRAVGDAGVQAAIREAEALLLEASMLNL